MWSLTSSRPSEAFRPRGNLLSRRPTPSRVNDDAVQHLRADSRSDRQNRASTGTDRGAKVVARALRDAGMEVIYAGLRQTPEEIVESALEEDVRLIGLSILSGAHMALFPRVLALLKQKRATRIASFPVGSFPTRTRNDSERWGFGPSSAPALRSMRLSQPHGSLRVPPAHEPADPAASACGAPHPARGPPGIGPVDQSGGEPRPHRPSRGTRLVPPFGSSDGGRRNRPAGRGQVLVVESSPGSLESSRETGRDRGRGPLQPVPPGVRFWGTESA